MIARRTALLARVQAAREQRRRSELLDAQQAQAESSDRRDAAEIAVVRSAEARLSGLRTQYDELASRSVGGTDIQTLRHVEQAFSAEQARQERLLQVAETKLAQAEMVVSQATQAYRIEANRTRKREKLAERAGQTYRRLTTLIEDAAAEDEMDDRLAVVARV